MIIIAFLNFLIILTAKLAYDIHLFQSNKDVKHVKEAIAVIVGLVPSWIILYDELNVQWFFSMPLVTLLLFLNFWNLFDGIYNGLRDHDWFFNGSVDGADSKLDLFLMKLPVWLQAVIKIGGSVATIFLYYKIYA